MKIFCPVWGEKHLNLLKTALGKSLSWPENKKAIDGAEWIFVTSNKEEFETAKNHINAKASFFHYPALIDPKIRRERTLLQALEQAIEYCLNDHEPMLMATPDYIFGDGTISAFKELADDDACVSMAHMRCTPNVIEFLTDKPPTNAELMAIGMTYPHDCWTKSEKGLQDGYTVFGGIQWTKTKPGTYLIRHWLPAPFYANFIQDDLDFFRNFKEGHYNGHLYLKTFALWDHLWASRLIDTGRLRLIGSSDAGMMIEVTDRHENHPRPNPIHLSNKYGYALNQPHNHIQKQFVSVFRSDG